MIYDTPAIFQNHPTVIAAQSTRLGGHSTAPYDTLNLGLNTDDAIHLVQKNRTLFFESLGFENKDVAHSHQVHGDKVYVVSKAVALQGYDALVTNKVGILLSVSIADCVPILVYDPIKRAIAAIHSGWKGTTQSITTATIKTMNQCFGTAAKDCLVYIGTSICAKTFEVDNDVARHFDNPYKHWDEDRKKFLIDLRRHNHDQLTSLGVLAENIETSTMSTVLHNNRYFSYRKERGKTGRMLAVIGLK